MVLHRARTNSHKVQQYTAHRHLYSSLSHSSHWNVVGQFSTCSFSASNMTILHFMCISRTRSTTEYKDFDLAHKGERERRGKLLLKSAFKGTHTQSIYRDRTRVFSSEVCVCAWFHTDLHYTLTQAWVSLVKPKYKLSLCKAHKGTLTEQTNTLKRKQTLSASVPVATNSNGARCTSVSAEQRGQKLHTDSKSAAKLFLFFE